MRLSVAVVVALLLVLVAAMAAAPAKAQDPNTPVEGSLFVLRLMTPQDRLGGCEVGFFLLNGYEDRLDQLWLSASLHSPEDVQLDVVRPNFEFVDSFTAGIAEVFVDIPCTLIAYVRVREVAICQLGGERYGDCADLLRERLTFPASG